jgi:ATP-dependent Lon protease
VRRVVLPAANVPELELLPEEVRAGIEFVPVRLMDDVLKAALATVPRPLMSEGVRDLLSGGAELGSVS